MEGAVKRKQVWVALAIATALAAGLSGCKDDSAAIKALQDLNGQLSQQIVDLNEEAATAAASLQTCLADVAKTKGEAVVVTSVESEVEVPVLEGEPSLESLEALKKSLTETLESQKATLAELKSKAEQCAKDLEAARAEAEAAAKAKAAAAAAAKKEAEKPAVVKQREAEGRPTKGTGSRYQKRQ
jgi:colicin import membrane protein